MMFTLSVKFLRNPLCNSFTSEEKEKRPQLCHLPFGFGPRNCIGMRFALMEAKMVLISILKKYKFICGPKTEVSYVNLIIMHLSVYSGYCCITKMSTKLI